VAQHEAIAALVPGARLVVVDDAGHMSPMERPEPVARALCDWWRDATHPAPPA
jgi:pimeloyl-ACP methyl ester carboxylesterase